MNQSKNLNDTVPGGPFGWGCVKTSLGKDNPVVAALYLDVFWNLSFFESTSSEVEEQFWRSDDYQLEVEEIKVR